MADISMLEQLNGNSRIGGFTPDNFSGDNVLAMEEKDDQIEALKSQIELLESREAAQNIRVDDLTEENENLDKLVKKWISKFDQEIEKNSAKFKDLN